MVLNSVEVVIRSLNEREVRYLVAGGLAVVAHGYVRLTAGVDLIVDLERANLDRAIVALSRLAYRPRAPVRFEDFAQVEFRTAWAREKGMAVFSLYSPEHAATEIDLFVEAPLDFAAAWSRCTRLDVAPGVTASFVSFDDLLDLKRRAGRPQDLQDVEHLERLKRER